MAQRKILIPVDGSVASTRAFERHLDSLQKKGNMVYIVDVADKTQILGQWHLDGLGNGVDMVYIVRVPEKTKILADGAVDVMTIRQVDKKDSECFEDKLNKYMKELMALQVKYHDQFLEQGGEAGEQIVRVAIDENPNWIIMDTSMGSISEYVINNAPPNCSVIPI